MGSLVRNVDIFSYRIILQNISDAGVDVLIRGGIGGGEQNAPAQAEIKLSGA